MDLSQEKQQIISTLRLISTKDYLKHNDNGIKAIQQLMADITNDFYTIVVLGEFKRGKSTFINALLGKSILPMDILPETATINAIMYNQQPVLRVVYNDGKEKDGDFSNEFLKQFSARQENNLANKVRYIKIGYPLDLLQNRVVLVDTPGVSDMDEQRCDVTYQFLPKANAVIFLLDANSPLKKTEWDFIDKRLLPLGIKNILFLLNKYDCVDEEEDEDLLDDVKERLNKIFKAKGINNIQVLPLSAKYALQAAEDEDIGLLHESGITQVQKRLHDMLFDGDIERDKIDIYKNRLLSILTILENDLSNLRNIRTANQEQLKSVMNSLNVLIDEKAKNKKNIAEYVDEAKNKIYAMADKSLQFFDGRLEEDIVDMVESYQGSNFKDFVERNVNKRIQHNLEGWVGVYTPHIDTLLKQIEQELARGMSRYFNRKINMYTNRGGEIHTNKFILTVQANDISSTVYKAGAIAAVGSVGLMAIVGGIVMPLIGFAALPFLREHMMKKKLTEAKAKVLPELKVQIKKALMQLRVEIHKYIDNRCNTICSNTEYAYEEILNKLKQRVEDELVEKNALRRQLSNEINTIDDDLSGIRKIKEQLQ